jgi:hypothetical protein
MYSRLTDTGVGLREITDCGPDKVQRAILVTRTKSNRSKNTAVKGR